MTEVAAAAALAEAQTRISAQLYARQRPVLQELYNKRGVDVFIADHPAIQTSEGDVITVATWTEGVLAAPPVFWPTQKKSPQPEDIL